VLVEEEAAQLVASRFRSAGGFSLCPVERCQGRASFARPVGVERSEILDAAGASPGRLFVVGGGCPPNLPSGERPGRWSLPLVVGGPLGKNAGFVSPLFGGVVLLVTGVVGCSLLVYDLCLKRGAVLVTRSLNAQRLFVDRRCFLVKVTKRGFCGA
jgi:hypothetical protein